MSNLLNTSVFNSEKILQRPLAWQMNFFVFEIIVLEILGLNQNTKALYPHDGV